MKQEIFTILMILVLALAACKPILDDPLDMNETNVTMPPDNETSMFPIATAEESREFTSFTMGIDCVDPHIWQNALDYPVPQDRHGYYGYRGTTVINGTSKIVGYMLFEECLVIEEYYDDGRPKSGKFLFRLDYDPNNGWIRRLACNWDLTDQCPEDEDGNFILIRDGFDQNPNYEVYLSLGDTSVQAYSIPVGLFDEYEAEDFNELTWER